MQIGNIIIEFGTITEVLITYLLIAFIFTSSVGLPFLFDDYDRWYKYVFVILFMPFIYTITLVCLIVEEIKNKRRNKK